MLSNNPHIIHFLRDLPFFKGLPENGIEELLRAAQLKSYAKNEKIFHHGDTANRLFIIVNGWVKLYRNTEEGDEPIIALFTRGDVFGEAAVFVETDYPFSATAAEQLKLIEIPTETIRQEAKSNPDIMNRIMQSMAREMHKLQIENEHMALMSASQRVGCLLLQLSSGMRGKGGTFSFPFDKSLAAARLGMKPETFSRALSQLKDLGVKVKGSDVTIDSFSCLSSFACGHCSADFTSCKGAGHKECKDGCDTAP